MRVGNDEGLQLGPGGEADREQGLAASRALALLEEQGRGGSARRIAPEGFGDGRRHFRGAVVLDQAQQLSALGSGGFAALEGGLQEAGRQGDGRRQAAGSGSRQGFLFAGQHGLDVSGIVDPLTAIVAAAVVGDLDTSSEQAHGGWRGQQGQAAADRLGRDGVVVQIEAHVDGLAGADGEPLLGVEGVGRQRQQARLFLLEGLGHREAGAAGPGALLSDLLAPFSRLAVEVLQGGEGTGGKKAGADILNGALDAALLVAAGGGAGAGGEVIVPGQLQPAGMKANGVATGASDTAGWRADEDTVPGSGG